MKFNERTIEKLFQESLIAARSLLAALPVAEGREPNLTGLNGWIYEQTIRYCLCQELITLGLSPIIKEQVPLHGRTKIDLLVGKLAIEIKALGSFGGDAKKYSGYKAKVEERGWIYCYLTRSESYKPYRLETESTFRKELAFFLDSEGDWPRFVREVMKNY
jgi:hypothetical protein